MSPVATVATSSAHLTSFDVDLTSTVTVHLMNSTATHQPSPVETVTSYIISDSYMSSFTISQNVSPSTREKRKSNIGIGIGIMVAVILLVTTAVTIIVVAVLVWILQQRRSKKVVDVQHKALTSAGSIDNPGIGICIYSSYCNYKCFYST